MRLPTLTAKRLVWAEWRGPQLKTREGVRAGSRAASQRRSLARKPAWPRVDEMPSQWDTEAGSRAGVGQGGFGGQACPRTAAPEPFSHQMD